MMADFKPDVAVATVDVGTSHRRQSEQHDGSRAGAGGDSSGGTGSSHKTNLLGRLASFFGRNRSSGGGSGSGSSGTSSSSSKKRRGGAPSRGNKAVVVLKAKSMNDLAFPAIESWQQDDADPSSAEQHHADREQQSTVPVVSSASNDSLFGLREAAAAASVEDVPDGGGWGRLAAGSRALSQSADALSPPEAGTGIASVSSSLPSSGADGQSLAVGLGTSSRQLQRTDGRQLKQRPVSAVISAVSEDDGLPWSSVDSVSSTPPTSGVDYDSSRRAASRGTAIGVIAAAMPASKRFMFASDSMLSSTHRNSDSGILSDRSTDTEEEFFRDPWRASQHAGSRRHLSSDSDSDVDAIDLDIITKTEALTNPGARHKQLLRPKKSKTSVPAMPKVEEKNVLEIASCFGADGSRRQLPTATASFGDAEIVGARLSDSPTASAAATAAAPTSGHRRLSATNSVPPSLLSREVADAVRGRRRSSSDAAEPKGASLATTDSAAPAIATTEAVAAIPSSGSVADTPAAPVAGTSMRDVSSSLPHDDRRSEVVEHAVAARNHQPKQAAPGGSVLPREPAAKRPLAVDSPSSASASVRRLRPNDPHEASVAQGVRDVAAAHEAAAAVGSPSVTVSSPALGDQARPADTGSVSAREGEAVISPVSAALQLRHADDRTKSRTALSKQFAGRAVEDRPRSSARDVGAANSASAAAGAAEASSGAAVSDTAVELRKTVDSDVRPSAAGRLPSASVALVSSVALSPVPDVAGTDASATTAAAAVAASIADAQASDLVTGAAALAKYKSMFKQKPAIASVAAPAGAAAAHSPGDHNSNEAMRATNLAKAKPLHARPPPSTAAESRLTTSYPTTETESNSAAAPMALPLPADAVVPVAVVSATLASGPAPPEQPATSSATTVPVAPGVASSGALGAGKGFNKPSSIPLPSGSVSKLVKPLPSAGASTTKAAHVSDRSPLPITLASRASLVDSQVLPSAAAVAAATAVAETPPALPSPSGSPVESGAAAALPHLPHDVDAADIGELAGRTSSSVLRADQSREHVSLRHSISLRKPQESSHIPKVAAAALPAKPSNIGVAPTHTSGPERAPGATAPAVAVDSDGNASYKRKSVRELVSQSSPAPATVDAAAARPGLSHGPSVRRQQQPPLPHLSSTHQQPAVALKERPGDRAEDASGAGVAMAASRQPAGEPAPAAGMASVPATAAPRYSGASSSSSNVGSGTATSRKSAAVLSVAEPSAAGGDAAARGSTPVTLSQPRQLNIGRLSSSRSHNADQAVAAAATVVAAPSATVSSHHGAASATATSSTPNAAPAVSKLAHPSSVPKPSRGLAGSNSNCTQERSRGNRGDAPTSSGTSPAALPDVLPPEPRPFAVGSAAAALPDAAELDSSPAAVSAEKAASVKDRMKLFQRR